MSAKDLIQAEQPRKHVLYQRVLTLEIIQNQPYSKTWIFQKETFLRLIFSGLVLA